LKRRKKGNLGTQKRAKIGLEFRGAKTTGRRGKKQVEKP